MSVEVGLDGAIPATQISSQHKAMLENREAFQHAGDWTLAVVTEAQKDLAKTGERILPGNDLRKKDTAPQNKYQAPTR